MARPQRRDRASVADTTLTLRLTHEDRALLTKLVELRAAELSAEGVETTAASYVRGLIRKDAAAKGLLPLARPRRQARPSVSAEQED